MDKWEYLVLVSGFEGEWRRDTDPEDQVTWTGALCSILDWCGKDGWDVVAYDRTPERLRGVHTVILKRKLSEASTE